MNKKDKINCLGVCVSGTIFIALLSYAPINNALLKRDLDKRGVTTYGIIYRTDNQRSRYGNIKETLTYRYYFEVNGVRYNGNFSAHWKRHFHLDDTVKIRYDSIKPSRNKALIEKRR